MDNRNTPAEPVEVQHETRPPRTPWVLLLPLALFAGAMWQNSRPPDTPLGSMDMNGTVKRQPADNAVDNSVGNAATNAAIKEGRLFERTVFVPDDDGYLRKRIIIAQYPGPTTDWPHFYGRMSAHLVQLMLRDYPENFPEGTKILEEGVVKGDVVTLNFNRAFEQPEFWQGSTRTLNTIYSIVNTVSHYGARPGKETPSVRLLVEGKPVESLGEIEADKPFKPDMSLVKPG
jgi:hypothetical protein